MKLIDIKPGDGHWNEVWALYEYSFPMKERRSAEEHAHTLLKSDYKPNFAVDGDGKTVAILFYWDNPDYLYIEHLAVDPELRGQNIGSKLLRGFIEDNPGRRVILEIDPPEDDISIRRLNFYRRLGFVANDYHYIHPGFGPPSEALPHRLVLLSYPDALDPAEFENFDRYINLHVVAR